MMMGVFSLFARDVEILVVDTDLALPLEGAVIRSWDGAQYTCEKDGKAVISVPDNRQVVVQAAYPGYENGRLLVMPGKDSYTMNLRLSGIMENRELVVEAVKPGTSETRTGRSVAVSGRDIAQTAEIGIIEDVMSSIKLLPGVGYAGFFDAMPSIRGGDPGDMTAALDGYYVFNPYFWGGGFSIFDPRMVQSAQLSHGVFSSRYGHTVSGLLDISTKKPSPTETEFETAISTSAAHANLSLPIAGKGGVLIMGRVTYQDPIVALAKQLANLLDIEALQAINSIRVAPYIRSGTLTGNYRFLDNLEFHTTAFFGMDGVGVTFDNSSDTDALKSDTSMVFNWANYQGFITAGLDWNPRNDMLLKLTAGAGYEDAVLDGEISYQIHEKSFSDNFIKNFPYMGAFTNNFQPYEYDEKMTIGEYPRLINAQGRVDYDWELGNGFLAAAGAQELFNKYRYKSDQHALYNVWFANLDDKSKEDIAAFIPGFENIPQSVLRNLIVNMPVNYNIDEGNKIFTTSGYGLIEYKTPGGRFGTELGLRVDHYYLSGDGFSLSSRPAFSPRLNIDFNVFRDIGIAQSFDLSAGTGLFSSLNDAVYFLAEKKYGNLEMIPTRSWTSVLGARLEFSGGLIFNIEGYYKYIYDRVYLPISFGFDEIDVRPQTNGEGRAWGIDMMLQKIQSRYWDGWLSYSYTWVKYRDPDFGNANMDGFGGAVRDDRWYYPSFHRFHNLNLVSNFRPAQKFNIYARFGLASGLQLSRRIGDGPLSYPVYVHDPQGGYFIEEYYWPAVRDENNRTTPSLPLDVKFSIFGANKTGKAQYEIYVAIENMLALLYTARGNTSYNSYTGKEDTGSASASYEMPIPIPSFGFMISY
ncbi:MAG: hypothetical protein LBG95_00250 [Treponema sp.]|nr:hypothetical protein [Treponema sp.]